MTTCRRTFIALVLLLGLSDAGLMRAASAARDLAWPQEDVPPAADAPNAAPHRRRAHMRRQQMRQPVVRAERALDAPLRGRQKVVAPTAKGSSAVRKPSNQQAHPPSSGGKAKAHAEKASDADQDEAKPDDAADDADEDVEAIEPAEAVVATEGGAKAKGEAGWTFNKLMGHFHAAMVHLPIAWLLAWAGCETLALIWGHPFLQMAGLPIGLLTALSFAPSVLSGLMRLDELTQGSAEYDVGPALLHRNLNFVAWGVVALAVVLRLCNLHLKRGLPRTVYVGLVLAAFGIVGYSAHQGGVLVYGEEFFPF